MILINPDCDSYYDNTTNTVKTIDARVIKDSYELTSDALKEVFMAFQ